MIRNVVTGRLRDAEGTDAEADLARLEEALAGIAALDLPGQLSTVVGTDLGLRDGTWSFAITNDWADEESYRGYDADPEHQRHRARIVEVCAEVVRVQIAID